jgi:hypothetical protein
MPANPDDKSNPPADSTLRPPLRNAALNVVLLLGGIMVALGVSEVAIRFVAPQQVILKRPDIWRPDTLFGWVHHPNVHTAINTGERAVSYRTNSRGFRIGQTERDRSGHHVLLLGDSFMEALQVEYEQSLPGLLEHRLTLSLGVPVVVDNTGVGCWGPNQYLLQAKRSLSEDVYNLVLVAVFVDNDVVQSRRDRFPPRPPALTHALRFPRRFTWREITNAILYPINDALEIRSHLFIFFKTRLQTLLMTLGLSEAEFQDVFLKSERTSDRWDVTADILRDIASTAAAHDVPTMVVLLPASYQVDTAILDQYLRGFHLDTAGIDIEQPNRLLTARLLEHNLRVLDALPALRAAYQSGATPYGKVDRHLSPIGHDVVERLIHSTVADYLR